MAFRDELDRRCEARRRDVLPAKLLIDGETRPARVRNFSVGYLYVETADEPPSSAGCVLSFSAPEGVRFVLEAVTPRFLSGPTRSLRGLSAPGCAMRILNPHESYRRWVEAGIAATPRHDPVIPDPALRRRRAGTARAGLRRHDPRAEPVLPNR